MLDFDLANLYETETRILKQAVKRNVGRFPEDFMFQVTKNEWQQLITNCDKLPDGAKFSPVLPYAFTEHGVTMLASILKSKKAVQMNIAIVRAFIALTICRELQRTSGSNKGTERNHQQPQCSVESDL